MSQHMPLHRDQRRSDRDAMTVHALAMLIDAVSFISCVDARFP